MSERMLFCLGEGKYETKGIGYQKNYHIFNVQVTKGEYEKAIGGKVNFELPIAKWIDKEKMNDEEKKNNSSWKETGGYLKTLSWNDAWLEGWANASQEFKDWVFSLPNFSPEVFKSITGLNINEKVEELTLEEICKQLGKTIKIIK